MHWSIPRVLVVTNGFLAATAQEHSVFTKASNESLQWGAYRSNLYFGIKPRLPKSLMTGLLWARTEDWAMAQGNIRFTCEQSEGMAGYGWDVYDPRKGGVQTIHDQGNGLDIETTFVKFDEGRKGWAARIKGTPRDDAEPQFGSQNGVAENLKSSVWFTVGMDGLGSIELEDVQAGQELGFEGDVVFNGQSNELGDFKMSIIESEGKAQHPVLSHPSYQQKPLDHTLVHSLQIQPEAVWQSKWAVMSSMKMTVEQYIEEYGQEQIPPTWQTYTIQNKPESGNFHLVQKIFEGPFEFDVFYTPSTSEKTPSSDDLSNAIKELVQDFDEKFAASFAPKTPFKDDEHLRLGKALFSNLIGGIGYFHGDQMIDRSYAEEYEELNEGFWEETAEARGRLAQKLEGPYELFTSVPSRPFFPRGFLWDEGFHLLPMLDWDVELVMQIISSWFNTMDSDGWIAREQILGTEARTKVPPEFQTQYPHYANPPTLFLALSALLDEVEHGTASKDPALSSPEMVKTWFQSLYPLLQRNFEWYRKTQFGDLKSYDREAFSSKEAYRWRGRTPQHILTSGLDDYPRPQPPHPGELHVDLMAWMGLMARSIERVAKYIGENEDAASYSKILEAISRNVDDLHWNKQHHAYCDATVDDYEEHAHVCHKGYISIFPFMTGLLGPNHAHLEDVLNLIANEDELWSPFGIRSLSKRDEFYGTDENYWRSPVWMNMNYLILDNLRRIATQSGPHQVKARTMYTALRKNLVDTVYRSWVDTGFAWEQYNPETGSGQRTQHFTGWTSLIVKIMSMPELGGKASGGHDEL